MECIGFIIFMCVLANLGTIISWIVRGVKATGVAGYAAATGKDSFTSAFKSDFRGLGDFEVRVIESEKEIEGETESIPVFEFQVRGLIPHYRNNEELQINVNILDQAGKGRYVYSSIESHCEPGYRVFLCQSNLGAVPHDSGFKDWITIGGAFKPMLIFPHKGQRQLSFEFVVSRADNPVSIFSYNIQGDDKSQSSLYAIESATLYYLVEQDGYIDRIDRQDKLVYVHRHTVRLAMCMSAADGSIDKTEGEIIKDWAGRVIESQPRSRQELCKLSMNEAIRDAHKKALNGELTLTSVLNDLKECATDTDSYEAMELILDVMTADGEADKSELKLLDSATRHLGLDPKQVAAMRDRSLANVETLAFDEDDLATMVGIDGDMTDDEIRHHLNSEFKKWNSRQTSGDSATKKRANEMLELLSKARKRYLG